MKTNVWWIHTYFFYVSVKNENNNKKSHSKWFYLWCVDSPVSSETVRSPMWPCIALMDNGRMVNICCRYYNLWNWFKRLNYSYWRDTCGICVCRIISDNWQRASSRSPCDQKPLASEESDNAGRNSCLTHSQGALFRSISAPNKYPEETDRQDDLWKVPVKLSRTTLITYLSNSSHLLVIKTCTWKLELFLFKHFPGHPGLNYRWSSLQLPLCLWLFVLSVS